MFLKIKNIYCTIKHDILSYRSPLRWAFLSLLLACSLFCWEIALSCYSLYLSLVGGGVIVGVTWLDILFSVLAIIFGLAGVGGIVLMFFIIAMWWKDRDISKEDSIIQSLPKQTDTINKKLDKILKVLNGKTDV